MNDKELTSHLEATIELLEADRVDFAIQRLEELSGVAQYHFKVARLIHHVKGSPQATPEVLSELKRWRAKVSGVDAEVEQDLGDFSMEDLLEDVGAFDESSFGEMDFGDDVFEDVEIGADLSDEMGDAAWFESSDADASKLDFDDADMDMLDIDMDFDDIQINYEEDDAFGNQDVLGQLDAMDDAPLETIETMEFTNIREDLFKSFPHLMKDPKDIDLSSNQIVATVGNTIDEVPSSLFAEVSLGEDIPELEEDDTFDFDSSHDEDVSFTLESFSIDEDLRHQSEPSIDVISSGVVTSQASTTPVPPANDPFDDDETVQISVSSFAQFFQKEEANAAIPDAKPISLIEEIAPAPVDVFEEDSDSDVHGTDWDDWDKDLSVAQVDDVFPPEISESLELDSPKLSLTPIAMKLTTPPEPVAAAPMIPIIEPLQPRNLDKTPIPQASSASDELHLASSPSIDPYTPDATTSAQPATPQKEASDDSHNFLDFDMSLEEPDLFPGNMDFFGSSNSSIKIAPQAPNEGDATYIPASYDVLTEEEPDDDMTQLGISPEEHAQAIALERRVSKPTTEHVAIDLSLDGLFDDDSEPLDDIQPQELALNWDQTPLPPVDEGVVDDNDAPSVDVEETPTSEQNVKQLDQFLDDLGGLWDDSSEPMPQSDHIQPTNDEPEASAFSDLFGHDSTPEEESDQEVFAAVLSDVQLLTIQKENDLDAFSLLAQPSAPIDDDEDDFDFDFDLGLQLPDEAGDGVHIEVKEPQGHAFDRQKTPTNSPQPDVLMQMASNSPQDASSSLALSGIDLPEEVDFALNSGEIPEDEFFQLADSLAMEQSSVYNDRRQYRGEPVMRGEFSSPGIQGGIIDAAGPKSDSISGENPFAHVAPTGVRNSLADELKERSKGAFELEEISAQDVGMDQTPIPSKVIRNAPLAEHMFDDTNVLDGARLAFEAGEFSDALMLTNEAINDGDKKDAFALKETIIQEQQRQQLLRLGSLSKTPTLNISLSDLANQALDHRAGFLISMFDGMMTFEDVLDVSNMPRLETMTILAELLAQNIIKTD